MALRFLNSGYFAGKVGIGTETPTAPLDVFGVRAGRDWAINNRAVIRLDSNGAGYPSDILFGHTAAANQTSWTGVYWSLSSRGSSDAGKFHFYRGNGHDSPYSSEAVIMTFKPDLKVGIGTTNPAQNFVVADATNGNGVELVPGTTATIQTYNRGTSSYNNLNIDTASTRVRSFDYTSFHNGSGYGEKMRITSDGDLGINTTLPNFKLDVDGTFGVSDLPFNTNSVSVLVADETIASEIITNGSFDTDLTDWTNSSSYPWTSATWTSSGVSLQTSGSSQYKSFYQDIGPITLGKTYKISYSAVKTSGTMRVGVETSPVGSSVGYQKALTSSEVVSEVFTATTTDATCVISFWGQNDSSTNEWVIDNVSIKEVTSASNQIQKRELGTGAFGPTPVGAYLPLTAGSGFPLTGDLYLDTPAGASQSGYALKLKKTSSSSVVQVGAEIFATPWASNTNGGTIIFKNADTATNLQETLRISANGSVGINSTSSSYKLDVGGNARFQDSVYINTSTGAGGLYVTRLGGATESLKISTTDSTSVFETFQDENTGVYGSMAFVLDNGAPDPAFSFKYGSIVRLKIEGGTGDVILKDALLSNQKNTDIDTGAEVVAQVATLHIQQHFLTL